ncbi:MAG TPA: F0F1 ATP synthase subunit A [Tepidisphaeraceae bacterium]|nr:F0F1 ATP synthase subunit A [Tepidisphaeraceae bacterium]
MLDVSLANLQAMLPLAAGSPLEHVVDHPIIQTDGGWYLLTNHMIMLLISAALMLLIFPAITRRYRSGEMVPTGTRNFFEAIILYVRNDIAKPVLGDEADRFMPFLWTLFFFILFNNLLGLLPLDVITGQWLGLNHGHGIYGTATANLAVTGVLAILSFLVWNVSGIRANGMGKWAHHFLGGAPLYMAPVMVPVEILGMFVKPFALAIRLMANMTAGHVLVAVLIGLSAVVWRLGTAGGVAINGAIVAGTTAIMLLELFVAFLQAYIFTFLTTLFIGQMVVHEHEHTEEHGEHGHHDERHENIGSGNLGDFAELPEDARRAGTGAAG